MSTLTVVTPYGSTAASRRVRVDGWVRHLGLEVELTEYLGTRDNRPRTLARRPGQVIAAERDVRRLAERPRDRVLVQREATPISRGSVEARLLARADHSVYDFDDALQWDFAGSTLRRAIAKHRKCLAAVRHADRVIAGNETLATWAAQWCRDVVVVPSCVEPDDYAVKQSYCLQDPPRLLWIGSPSTEIQLRAAAPALLEVAGRTGAVLEVVSSGDLTLGPLDAMVERTSWSFAATRSATAKADVAIGPLIDGLFEQGKCAYKLLQYAAAALPVVGTPVGANRRVLHAIGATPASTTQQWVDGLMSWIEASEGERAAAGASARAAVEEGYAYAAWSRVWRAAVGV